MDTVPNIVTNPDTSGCDKTVTTALRNSGKSLTGFQNAGRRVGDPLRPVRPLSSAKSAQSARSGRGWSD